MIMMVLAVGHVDAALDDRRAHQEVEAPVVEIDHQLLEIALAHLAVTDAHLRLRERASRFRAAIFSMLSHLVVHEVDLAAAAELAQRRLAQRRRMPFGRRRS